MIVYTLRHDPDSGRLIGATRASDGTQFMRNGAGWPDVVAWAAAQVPPVELADRAPATPEERAAREITAGITALLTGTDGYTSALRVILRGICTELNDLYERFGLPRKLEAERVQQWVRDAMAGAGAPPSAPPSAEPKERAPNAARRPGGFFRVQ